MQKHANRILSALLALIMVISMVPATVFATGETANALKGWNIILGDDIGVKFTLNSADYTVITTVNGAEVTPAISGETVTVNVAAAQMTDTIGLTVKSGEETVHTGEYSVREYADKILGGSYDAEVKDMVKQMLNYGAAAQTYFNYVKDNKLANDGITVDAAVVPTEVPEIAVEDNLDGISLYGMSLVFRNKIAVRFYFNVTGDINSFTFSQGTPEEKNGLYYVEVAGINPQDMDKDITLNVNDGALSVTYSPMTYIVRQYNSEKSTAALKSLVQAMYGYHLEALEYQEYQKIAQLGNLQTHGNNTLWAPNANETFIYATIPANVAQDASTYRPLSADVIKLVRGGETFSVGIPACDTLEVINQHSQVLIKLAAWTISGSKLPLQAHDYLIIEGRFATPEGVTLQINKTYIYYNGNTVEISTEVPTLPTTVEGGTMLSHSNTDLGANGLYFKMEANAAPYNSNWSYEYKQTSVDGIKRIRNGETTSIGIVGRPLFLKYSETEYYLKLEGWTLGENATLQTNDILVIEGEFYHEASKTTLKIAKSYIYYDGSKISISSEMPKLPTTVEGGVMMKVDGYGWTGGTGALIFKMANTAPNGGYTPTDASNIKLIRNGETYDVAYVGQNVINKSNDNWYTVEFWTIVNYKPLLANDILVIEGNFYQESTKTTLNVSKTYVLLNADGSASFSAEMPSLTTVIDAGMMSAHANGWKSSAESAGNLQFAMAANEAPNGYYRPTSAANVKLIRNGVTYEVGHNLRDTISKVNNDQYILEFWTIADHKPLVANDILIVEGEFTQESSNTVLNITKTYILLNADGSATFSAEMPSLTTVIDAGLMSKVDNYGWNESSMYFQMAANDAPDAVTYQPTDAACIKVIRNGETINDAMVGQDVIYKSNDTFYEVRFWTFVNTKPLQAGDIIVFEGDFYNAANDTILRITKTYALLNADGTVTFSATEPTTAVVVDGGNMAAHADGYDPSEGVFFTLAENAVPVDENVEIGYAAGENVIKLVRDGETYNMVGSVYKFGDADYYLHLSESTYLPLQKNDYLIVEGGFVNADNGYTLNIAKTYILVDGDAVVFSTTEPEIKNVIEVGMMNAHESNGWTAGDGILYFSMADNDAPTGRYKPVDNSNVKLIRGDQTIVVGHTLRETINKESNAQYIFEFWTLADYKPVVAGDILLIEGDFVHADGTIINISKTYVLFNADKTASFSATEPPKSTVINAGLMSKLDNYGWNENSMYFQMAANDAPDAVTYQPTDAACIKVIRNGETSNDAMVGQDVVYKSNDTFYEVRFWTFVNTKPLQAGDIIVFEGDFYNAANDTILRITKTYALLNADGTVTFSDTEPSTTVIDAGLMSKLDNYGWTENNLYFQMAANDAPDNAGYQPTDAACIKVIRNGETINDAMVGQDVIYKANDTFYEVRFWTFVNTKPLQAGDIIVFEGDFYNAANDTILRITKTYALLNADGTVTFSDTEPVLAVQGGMMQEVTGYGWSSSEADYGSVIFKMSNDAPNGDYQPTSASNIKLIRDGVTYDVARMGAGVVNKSNADWYTIPIWTIVDFRPLRANDILIVEGLFKHAGSDTMLNITKTYALLNADGTVTFSDTEPSKSTVIDAGVMIKLDGYGWTADNLYFKMAENDAPDNAGYQPTDASCIKVIRNGETVNDAMVGQDVINKANDGWYNVAFWTFVNTKPLQAGDIIVFEGDFYNAANDTILRITKTYAQLNAGGTVTFFDDSDMYINAGVIGAYTQGWFNNGFFFTMAANNAPAGSLDENNGGDWTVEYTPSSAAVIKLVRDGVATEIAMVDRGTITKLTDTVYYFRIDDWATPYINNKANLRDGDMLVVEGEFYGKPDTAAKGYTLNISKSYIIFTSMEDEIITFSTGAETEFGDVVLPSSNKTLNIGMWNGSYHVFTDERLAELQAAGITKIMGIDPQWTGAEYGGITGMLDRAAAYGIDVIVDLRTWDGTSVPEYVNHPALLGFVMYDEPSTSKFNELAELKAQFDKVMPDDVLFFVNLFGSSAAKSSLGINNYGQNYETHYVQRFLDELGVEVLSWDSYCLLEGTGIRTGYFYNFEVMASKASTEGVTPWYTMLSSGHNTTVTHYNTPTAAELRWQMAVAMTYGISNIDHYIYTSHEEGYSCMYDLDTGAVTDLYYDVKAVDNEYLAWDHIYMAYEWVGVGFKDVGTENAMFKQLQKEIQLADYGLSVESTEDMLVGVFQNNGNVAYMITNAGNPGTSKVGDGVAYTNNDATVTLKLAEGDYKCAAVISQGEITYVAVENNTVTIAVDAYEGVFVIPVLN